MGSFNEMCTACQTGSSVATLVVFIVVGMATVALYRKSRDARDIAHDRLAEIRNQYALLQAARRHVHRLGEGGQSDEGIEDA
jgi:hypothetical protein